MRASRPLFEVQNFRGFVVGSPHARTRSRVSPGRAEVARIGPPPPTRGSTAAPFQNCDFVDVTRERHMEVSTDMTDVHNRNGSGNNRSDSSIATTMRARRHFTDSGKGSEGPLVGRIAPSFAVVKIQHGLKHDPNRPSAA